MKKMTRALALTAATLPLLASSAFAAEAFDPRALGLGGHYSAYCNSDVNGTLINPALLHYQRGTFYLGPNMGLTLGTTSFSGQELIADQANLLAYSQYLLGYMTYGQSAIAGTATDADLPTAPAGGVPTSLSALKENGLTLNLGARAGLLGLKFPFPSILGVKEPYDPEKAKPVKKAETSTTTSSSAMITAKGDVKVTTTTTTAKKDEKPYEPGLAWGALGVRVYGDGGADIQITAPDVMGFLFDFPTLDQQLKGDITALKTEMESNTVSPSALLSKVNNVRSRLTSPDGFGKLLAGDKGVTMKMVNKAYGTGAVSLSQPIPFPTLGIFPQAKAAVGGTFKLFYAPGDLNKLMNITDPGIPTIGSPGSLTLNAALNLKEPLTALDGALDTFSKDFTKAGEMANSLGSFGAIDYNKALTITLTSKAASSVGFGADLGLNIDLNKDLSVGAALLNPIVVWPGTELTQTGSFVNGKPTFTSSGQKSINFTDTEPMAITVGASYHLPLGFTIMGDLQQTMENDLSGALYGPSAQAGLEWNIFNFLYARAGARVGGKDPIYGAGLGLNLFLAHVDLGAGIDPSFKQLNIGLSTAVGF